MSKATGFRSIAVALTGLIFVVAARFIPKEYLTPDLQESVVQGLIALYALFFAAKVSRYMNSGGNTK